MTETFTRLLPVEWGHLTQILRTEQGICGIREPHQSNSFNMDVSLERACGPSTNTGTPPTPTAVCAVRSTHHFIFKCAIAR